MSLKLLIKLQFFLGTNFISAMKLGFHCGVVKACKIVMQFEHKVKEVKDLAQRFKYNSRNLYHKIRETLRVVSVY